MTCAFGGWPFPGVVNYPVARGKLQVGAGFVQKHTLPTDPAGTVYLTFPRVKSGSEIHAYQASIEVAGVESASPGEVLRLNKYALGNPNNTVRIFIASLGYENLDFDIELTADSDVPTFQRTDRNFRNPA